MYWLLFRLTCSQKCSAVERVHVAHVCVWSIGGRQQGGCWYSSSCSIDGHVAEWLQCLSDHFYELLSLHTDVTPVWKNLISSILSLFPSPAHCDQTAGINSGGGGQTQTHLAWNLLLNTGNPLDLDLSDDPSPVVSIDGQPVRWLHSIQGESKAPGVTVRPEVVVVEVQGVPSEGQSLAVTKADGLKSKGPSTEEVALCSNMADAVAETWQDSGIHIDTCQWQRMSALSHSRTSTWGHGHVQTCTHSLTCTNMHTYTFTHNLLSSLSL